MLLLPGDVAASLLWLPLLPHCRTDKAAADKQRVADEIAAMDPAVVAAAKEAAAAKKSGKKADKAAEKAEAVEAAK